MEISDLRVCLICILHGLGDGVQYQRHPYQAGQRGKDLKSSSLHSVKMLSTTRALESSDSRAFSLNFPSGSRIDSMLFYIKRRKAKLFGFDVAFSHLEASFYIRHLLCAEIFALFLFRY